MIRKRSEWHRNRVELRADIGRIGRTELLCDVAIEVVQHEADIAVGVPVQRRGVDRLSSAGDAVCAGKLIVQIDGREADGDLPSAPAAARELLLEGQYSEARLDKVSNAIQEALVGYRHVPSSRTRCWQKASTPSSRCSTAEWVAPQKAAEYMKRRSEFPTPQGKEFGA